MSTASTPKHGSGVVYPDSDGKPMADNTRQFRWIVIIKEGLEFLFRDRPDIFVAGDLLWYAHEGDPKVRMAPDALVVFGRPKGDRGSYMQWVEGGIAPQVVFEVHSPGNRRRQLERKFRFYKEHGVQEYYYYNPDNGKLTGWIRSGTTLEPIPSIDGFTSPRLGVRFEPGKGPEQLKIIGPDGRQFLSPLEVAERWEAERQRADVAQQRAERLAARLRELGEDVD
jgi:Uma2 family endonuclease